MRALPKAAGLLLLLVPGSAFAWKPYTHNFIGNEALADAIDDGQLTINGRQYALRPELVAALRAWPQFFHAGVVGPDGFPDLTYGQSVIHPGSTASPDAAANRAFTGAWLRHVYNQAWTAQSDASYSTDEKAQILAFTYGFLAHAAGDMWAHTLVNDFSGGVFPAFKEIPSDIHKAEIAIKHLLVEGYLGNGTPGFDVFQDSDDPRDARGPAPGGDVSDDSTPGFPYDAPHRFLYDTLIDPAAATPVAARGPLIDFFQDLSSTLSGFVSDHPDPLADAISAYDDLAADLMSLQEACDFDDIGDIIDCPAALLELGFDVVIDSFEAFLAFVADVLADAALLVLDAYLNAWVNDIDDGLHHWSEFGLATTEGLFDPQARRDVQNEECDCPGCGEDTLLRAQCEDGVGLVDTVFSSEGTANDFINDHLLSMLGAPDVIGDLRSILQDFTSFLDDVLDVLLAPFNPLREALAELKLFFTELVQDAIEDAIGIDIDALSDFLTHPSRFVCLDETPFTFPDPLGTVTLSLFAAGEHERLDGLMGLGADHHVEEEGIPEACGRLQDSAKVNAASFAAFGDTITMSKLLLLDGSALNQVLGDLLGRTISIYQPDHNVMIDGLQPETWLKLIDGDHAWRVNGLPRFCDAGTSCPAGATERSEELDAGTGLFPIWASCVLRPSFRSLFQDWENGTNFPADNFPDDPSDPVAADPADDPNAPTSSLARTGAFYSDGARQFIGADNGFTFTAHDTPAGQAFRDDQLALERRTYTNAANPGPFVDVAQGDAFALGAPDGQHFIDIRSADDCHTFTGAPLPPEPTQTFEYWLDTTAPTAICNTPPFGLTFDTDDVSAVSYGLTDGASGSGVASSSSTIDGFLALPGVVPIANGAALDMYFYYPGTRTVAVSATDHIGNAGVSACTFEIHATADSLISNLDRANTLGLIKNAGLFGSVMAKLEAAKQQHDRGNTIAELNQLQAFVNELQAQGGMGIDLVTADRLIAYALDLIAHGG
jgi:hypothetical protein